MKKTVIFIILIYLFPINIFSQTEKVVLQPDEKRLFYLINAMRKDRKIKPLKFSNELYLQAKKLSEEMATTSAQKGKEAEGKVILFRAILSSGANYIEETVASIRNNFSYYRRVINSEMTESAVAIYQDKTTRLYYMIQLFRKGNPTSDAYYLEEKEFKNLLDLFQKVPFHRNQKTVLERLDEFIHHPKSLYSTTITANSINIFLKDVHIPYSYVQFSFSNMPDIFPGVHTKSYFFKQRDSTKEIEQLETIYGTHNKPADQFKNFPYYLSRKDEKLKLYYWLTEDEIIELRWLGKEGVYISITKTAFGLRYVNQNKKRFNLQYPLSKRVYLRLLQEFLKRSSHFELAHFLNNCKLSFLSPGKESKVEMSFKGEKAFEIYYYYNSKGVISREEFFYNNKKTETWFYDYSKSNNSVKINIISHTEKGKTKSFELTQDQL